MPVTPKNLRKINFTVSKVLPYRCVSPHCRAIGSKNPEYEKIMVYLHSPLDKCKECGENAYWFRLSEIHLILPEKRGIIVEKELLGPFNERVPVPTGNRLEFLCDKSRAGYREPTRSPNQPAFYTQLPEQATCWYCLKSYNKDHHPLAIVTDF